MGAYSWMLVYWVLLQILQLLKSSFTSTNVLNDVFGKYCADVKSVGTALLESFFSQSICGIVC